MATVKAAAVQAAYVLMDRQACVDKAVRLIGEAAEQGAAAASIRPIALSSVACWFMST